MAGEFLREAAVLVGVFVPIDMVMAGHGLTLKQFGGTLAVVGVLWGIGAYLGVDNDE